MRILQTIACFLFKKDRGQDVAEYCLITALIALIGLAIFWHVSGGIQGMWASMNTSLAAGNTSLTNAGGLSGR